MLPRNRQVTLNQIISQDQNPVDNFLRVRMDFWRAEQRDIQRVPHQMRNPSLGDDLAGALYLAATAQRATRCFPVSRASYAGIGAFDAAVTGQLAKVGVDNAWRQIEMRCDLQDTAGWMLIDIGEYACAAALFVIYGHD